MKTKARRITFVTGTDTEVGKTVFTAFAVHHLRQTGVRALAMKPFCSGDRRDAEILCRMQNRELPLEVLNPFYFPAPLAPLLGARQQGRRIEMSEATAAIQGLANQCEHLLVEGAGGILAPLGEGFGLLELIRVFEADVMIVAANRLGVVNHLRLTAAALGASVRGQLGAVLMDPAVLDVSTVTNLALLQEFLPAMPLFPWPHLGGNPCDEWNLENNWKKVQKTLADVF